MTEGFAFVAYPADYRSSGVMTFIVNEDGVVYQKDLGWKTGTLAQAMKEFSPGAGWQKAEDQQWQSASRALGGRLRYLAAPATEKDFQLSEATLSSPPPVLKDVVLTSINTIRTLSIDGVQAADSGHPGTPMALAPVAHCLWQQFLRFVANRDAGRMVFSEDVEVVTMPAARALAQLRVIRRQHRYSA